MLYRLPTPRPATRLRYHVYVVRGDLEQRLAQTYLGLTYASALLMTLGWIWHLVRGDQTNWLITVGLGGLLLTPLIALAHLSLLCRPYERLTARYGWLALALLGVAVAVGLVVERYR